MNRLSNWFTAAKLAKLHLAQAKEDLAKNKTEKAAGHLVSAMEEMITGMNNISSIAFNKQPRRSK